MLGGALAPPLLILEHLILYPIVGGTYISQLMYFGIFS